MKILCYLSFIVVFFTGCAAQIQNQKKPLSALNAYYKNSAQRISYVSKHSNLSPAIKQAITEGKIINGMDQSTIQDLFGPPEKKHILENGLMEIWFYNNSHFAFLFNKYNKLIKFFPPKSLEL